jgi:1,4-alpha-glucan branching enzyme
VVWDLDYQWADDAWMKSRGGRQSLHSPISIYEVHLGSWMRIPEEGNRSLNYREIAPRLAEYAAKMNFTHVELLPIMGIRFTLRGDIRRRDILRRLRGMARRRISCTSWTTYTSTGLE